MARTPVLAGMSQGEVEQQLRQLGIEERSVVKALVLGNSGSGKSFLLDCAVGGAIFKHNYQARSVTDHNEFGIYVEGGRAYVYCNSPGLVEADESNIKRNVSCIESVFRWLPQASTVVVFVFTTSGGRPVTEDVGAFHAVSNFIKLNEHSIALAVNRVDPGQFNSPAERESWQADITGMLRSACRAPKAPVYFFPAVEKKYHADFDSPPLKQVQAMMLSVIRTLQPAPAVPAANARLVLEFAELKAELSRLRQELMDKQQQFADEFKRQTAEWSRRMEEQRVVSAQQHQQLQQELVELRNRPPPAPVIIHGGGGCCLSRNAIAVVRGRGEVHCGDVRAGDSVRTVVDGRDVWTEVYFAAVADYPRPMLRVVVACGECDERVVVLTGDHFVCTPSGFVSADSLGVGAAVTVSGGTAGVVRRVEAGAPSQLSIVLTAAGTVEVNGVVCSCYDGGHWIGWLENVDLYALYKLFGATAASHRATRRYALACDRFVHAPLRRLMSLVW